MEALLRCVKLRRATMSPEWEDIFMFYYRRAIDEDEKLDRAINGLCDNLTVVIEEMENFVDELDKLMKLQILGREFELRRPELFSKDNLRTTPTLTAYLHVFFYTVAPLN
ncbi:hypothetical protein Tco_0922846 [Tanacetum coccineum]|uniref:Uncharacterized protein n=1 Tax=Tanacetum coccineum TaxID=301880 RepID=A0ABQ5D0M5_9ASTR